MNLFKTLIAVVLFAIASLGFAAGPVDINRADATELTRLHGVGPAKAQTIIEYRDAHGPFVQVEDLALVKGIGLRTVERNRELISLGGEPVAGADHTR